MASTGRGIIADGWSLTDMSVIRTKMEPNTNGTGLIYFDEYRLNLGGTAYELIVDTNDVPTALSKALDAGAALVQDVEEMPWGQTTAYVTDNNGFLIELCTPVTTQP